MLLDCPTCGAPFPAGRRCCPHCHCSSPAWKRWAIAAAAAAGLGAADCGGTQPHEAMADYGPAVLLDLGHDAAVVDLDEHDLAEPPDGGS